MASFFEQVRNLLGLTKLEDVKFNFDLLIKGLEKLIKYINGSSSYTKIDYSKGSSILASEEYCLTVGGLKKIIDNRFLQDVISIRVNSDTVVSFPTLRYYNDKITQVSYTSSNRNTNTLGISTCAYLSGLNLRCIGDYNKLQISSYDPSAINTTTSSTSGGVVPTNRGTFVFPHGSERADWATTQITFNYIGPFGQYKGGAGSSQHRTSHLYTPIWSPPGGNFLNPHFTNNSNRGQYNVLYYNWIKS